MVAALGYVGLDWHDYVRIDLCYFRPTEVDTLLADASRVQATLGWRAPAWPAPAKAALSDICIDRAAPKVLAQAAADCWPAILDRDAGRFGQAVRRSFEAQVTMFPNMLTPAVLELIEEYRDVALGWKLSGAGGGGYLVLVAERAVENGIRLVARRRFE